MAFSVYVRGGDSDGDGDGGDGYVCDASCNTRAAAAAVFRK